MATKKTNWAKVRVSTAAIQMEFDGSIGACALELFGLIPTPAQRNTIFNLIKAKHEALVAEGR